MSPPDMSFMSFRCPHDMFEVGHRISAAKCRLCRGTGLVNKRQLDGYVDRVFRKIEREDRKRGRPYPFRPTIDPADCPLEAAAGGGWRTAPHQPKLEERCSRLAEALAELGVAAEMYLHAVEQRPEGVVWAKERLGVAMIRARKALGSG